MGNKVWLHLGNEQRICLCLSSQFHLGSRRVKELGVTDFISYFILSLRLSNRSRVEISCWPELSGLQTWWAVMKRFCFSYWFYQISLLPSKVKAQSQWSAVGIRPQLHTYKNINKISAGKPVLQTAGLKINILQTLCIFSGQQKHSTFRVQGGMKNNRTVPLGWCLSSYGMALFLS